MSVMEGACPVAPGDQYTGSDRTSNRDPETHGGIEKPTVSISRL